MKSLNPRLLTKDTLVRLVTQIQSALWFDADEDALTSDKEWDEETVEMVAEQLSNVGLLPEETTSGVFMLPEWFEAACEAHPEDDWRYEVANGDTRLGYEDWVIHQVEAE